MKNKIVSLIVILFMSISAFSLGSVLSLSKLDNGSSYDFITNTAEAATLPESSIEELETIGDAPYITFKKQFDSVSSNSQKYTGLVSYLVINFNPTSVSGLSNFKVQLAIGSLTYNISTDEKGTTIRPSIGGTYYFTRQATYIVSYKVGERTYTKQCYFTPEINYDVLNGKGLKQELKNVQYIDGKYYIIGNGLGTITQTICYNTDLYNLIINQREQAETPSGANTYTITIPANCYGKLTLTFSSKKGFLTRVIDIIVINPYYEHSFILYNKDGNPTSNDFNNYKFGTDSINKSDYYVFNSKVTLNLSLNSNLVDTDNKKYYSVSENPSEDEITTATNRLNLVKAECIEYMNLYSTRTTRNSNNTQSSKSGRVLIDAPNGPSWTADFDATDHSMYEMSSYLSFSTNTLLNTSIVSFKIITKIPVTTGKYDFAVYLTGSNTTDEKLNYLNTCLNGYLFDGDVIHTQNANTILRATAGTKYKYSINGTDDTMIGDNINIVKDSDTGINPYDIRIQTTEDEITDDTMFESFYTFNFNVTYYNNYSFFYYCLTDYISVLNNTAIIKGLTASPVVKALSNTSLNIGGTVSILDYDATCIPVYMQVTYNEKVYENFYNLKSGDEVSFYEYGNYVLELYTFPSYEFCKNFVEYWPEPISLSKYYARLEFVIDGPSITVTSTDNNGAPLVMTNNMYTNHDVLFDVTIREELNESFEVYRNNDLIYSNVVSEQDLPIPSSDVGTWKIVVLDSNRNILKSMVFTIADSNYQGFSIGHHKDYENLSVYKRNPATGGYDLLDSSLHYHLIEEGTYRVRISNGEKIYFNVKNGNNPQTLSASKSITNYINFNIVEPFFSITFETGAPGESITEKVSIVGFDGIDIQKVEVYRDDKFVTEFTPSDMSGFANILGGTTSYSDTGLYTIKLIDKFGNTYEVQIRKFYKANLALILLLIIAGFGVVFLIYFIFRSKRGLKVK